MRHLPDTDPLDAPAAERAWYPVHDVVGPLEGIDAPAGLYVHGAELGPVVATPTGPRRPPAVRAGATADFGTYVNAFPAGQWCAGAGVESVRLRVRVDAPAVLTLHRSTGGGAARTLEERLLAAGVPELLETALDDPADLGLLWFALQAGPARVTLLDAAWEVPAAPRLGGLVLGTPTTGRVADVAANLARVAAAPALAAVLDRVIVVDQAERPVSPALEAGPAAVLGPLLQVVRQPNIGGSGGYSRVMHEATLVPDAQAVLLLDDDVVVEPVALLKAFEFACRSTGGGIVGLQMLDAARPAVLEAAAEHIVDRSFWWAPADAALPGTDVAALPVRDLPALHGSQRADFAGWWGAVVPLDVVRAVGYAMPFFLKWDDAEYALRARAAGWGTISLQGAAVWHESWRGKDDARSWRAYFHARNRLLAALLHGSGRERSGVLLANLALEVKQLLALQGFAVERRHEGARAVLAGPAALGRWGAADLDRLLALDASVPDQRRIARAEAEGIPASVRRVRADRAPTGGRLAVWTAAMLLRHLLAPVRAASTRLPAGRGTWGVLPWFDDVLAPTADGDGYFRLTRDRRRFRAALATSVALHVRLWLAWPRLRRRYRAAAPALASPAAWLERFAGDA